MTKRGFTLRPQNTKNTIIQGATQEGEGSVDRYGIE